MAVRSLGLVTATAATPVRLTANETDPLARVAAHSIVVQAWHNNSGLVYVGDRSTMVRATGVGVLEVLQIPVAGAHLKFMVTNINAPAGFNAADLWLDVDVNDDGVLVQVIT